MNSDKKIYITITIFVVVNLLFIFLLISPALNKIKKNSEELLNKKANLFYLEKEVSGLKSIQDTKNIILDNLKKINEIFIDSEIPVDFINFLEKEAALSQLLIEVSPITMQKITTDFWPSSFFQITVEGSFPNFLKFLEKIENGPYLTEIINLNSNRKTEKRGTGKNEVEVEKINSGFLIKVFTR